MEGNDAAQQANPDTLETMLRMAHSFGNWDHLISLADSLHDIAINSFHGAKPKHWKQQKPPIYYLGFSSLMKGIALKKKKQYAEALTYIEKYRDLSLFADGSEKESLIVDKFAFYAKANSYSLHILSGDHRQLYDYASFLKQHPAEALPGLISILEGANTHDFQVDEVIAPLLETLYHTIHDDIPPEKHPYYFYPLYLLSVYYFKNRRYDKAIDNVIQQMEFSDKINDHLHFKKAVALFEECRGQASPIQLESYQRILKNYLMQFLLNEEGFSLDFRIAENTS
ncbi:hypothetical protein P9847_15960 [Paenibacillus chibensis]|uniref:DNA-binding protein n=1 Tax=Paenibacillus chibensis TaxID=59846 RepID=A0ABU6PV89_9BACL|nr:hypothetical protein [Paenibacillus chibensis]